MTVTIIFLGPAESSLACMMFSGGPPYEANWRWDENFNRFGNEVLCKSTEAVAKSVNLDRARQRSREERTSDILPLDDPIRRFFFSRNQRVPTLNVI